MSSISLVTRLMPACRSSALKAPSPGSFTSRSDSTCALPRSASRRGIQLNEWSIRHRGHQTAIYQIYGTNRLPPPPPPLFCRTAVEPRCLGMPQVGELCVLTCRLANASAAARPPARVMQQEPHPPIDHAASLPGIVHKRGGGGGPGALVPSCSPAASARPAAPARGQTPAPTARGSTALPAGHRRPALQWALLHRTRGAGEGGSCGGSGPSGRDAHELLAFELFVRVQAVDCLYITGGWHATGHRVCPAHMTASRQENRGERDG